MVVARREDIGLELKIWEECKISVYEENKRLKGGC